MQSDCTACYLSEHSEAVRDLPLAEIFRRIGVIAVQYGRNTDIQITGADPTLRKLPELEAIGACVTAKCLRATLMTNGIKASKALLSRLAAVGLLDVAFHVYLIQQRKGYASEAELNALRVDYMQRERDAGLSVMFNTTVHAGNIDEIPILAQFFKRHAVMVRTASFQLQAYTRRGVLMQRPQCITVHSVKSALALGVEAPLEFEASAISHPECTAYTLSIVAGNQLVNLFADKALVQAVQAAAAHVEFERDAPFKTTARSLAALAADCVAQFGLVRQGARAQLDTLAFVIHEFMDASCLSCERIEACAFKVMTARGPISMCMHNAKRGEFILESVSTKQDGLEVPW